MKATSLKAIELDSWTTPATKYLESQKNRHFLKKKIYDVGYYIYHGIDGCTFFYVRQPITLTVLLEYRKGNLGVARLHEWMADDPPDYRAMQKYAEVAHGKVLTAGLGLGLLANELTHNKLVTDITIAEISQDVVDLVGPYLPPDNRIQVVVDNFWNMVATQHWDTIILDTWVYYGREQQIKQYKEEALPAYDKLVGMHPDSLTILHGFAGMPTIQQVDQAWSNGDDVDKLIYGLGPNWHTKGIRLVGTNYKEDNNA